MEMGCDGGFEEVVGAGLQGLAGDQGGTSGVVMDWLCSSGPKTIALG